MQLNWNEIKDRAIEFQSFWKKEIEQARNLSSFEKSNAQTFLIHFFNVFGIDKKRVAQFEQSVKKLNDKQGWIDCFWEGKIVIEMKSPDVDLEAATGQAFDYFHGLDDKQLPQYVMVCDFKKFILKSTDIVNGKDYSFELKDFYKYIRRFSFFFDKITNVDIQIEEDPVNFKAAKKLSILHEQLDKIGYGGHELQICLVRIIFCLFADDSEIWERNIFQKYIVERTREDGSDLAMQLNQIFEVLNTPESKRLKNIDEDLLQFPYVNGKLFGEMLHNAAFDSKMRDALIECCKLDWDKISPAIFGSIFQNVMSSNDTHKEVRRDLGAHYTSERNIVKVLSPLFLDELRDEFGKCKSSKNKLISFHDKIAKLKFLDPACGCGNFLVITYRYLRELEIDVLKELLFNHYNFRREVTRDANINVRAMIKCSVSQFYGIEVEEFPQQIAQLALWLTDHQMNVKASLEFGQPIPSIPLKSNPNIINGNAVTTDWQTLISGDSTFDYIFGNPPFSGARIMKSDPKSDMEYVFGKADEGIGSLDYVCAWYKKSAIYLRNHQQGQKTKCAFVSTNSIAQGEQVPVLWSELLKDNISVHFAHQTFKWNNEAKGKAAVYCVIIGFSNYEIPKKQLFIYEDIKGNPDQIFCSKINGYLIDAPNILISKRGKPICNVPEIVFGNMPNDGGNFLFTEEEKDNFIDIEPKSAKWIKPFISGHEFLHGENRYCLWLNHITPDELKELPEVRSRVLAVKHLRQASSRKATNMLAEYPKSFGEIRQPSSDYLLIPATTSENRKYIPMGFFTKNDIAANSCLIIPNASIFHFGILTSVMHMTWVKHVCGRLKSDFRYSNTIVYNNFPFPINVSDKQKEMVEKYAQEVLDTRAEYSNTLAELYDPITMPDNLKKAHLNLDKAVDKCYGNTIFSNEPHRMQFLFGLYQDYTSDLFKAEKKKSKSKKQSV